MLEWHLLTAVYVNVITKTLYFPPDFNIIQLWWEANNLIWMRCNEGPILVVRLVARDSKKAFTCKLKTIFSADFIAFIFQNMYLHFFTWFYEFKRCKCSAVCMKICWILSMTRWHRFWEESLHLCIATRHCTGATHAPVTYDLCHHWSALIDHQL